ncbi:DUF881 domain-containing protein [uncultured Nocardioides sp.]|uniref:DUF881 domain-containing protein n=1 Tax=uncultured Nocardioides sp. TaxID=198441 RepID=UPI0025FCCEC7|nr:DUF881 domain-containing protein [uncultured Nocardioides sp.]
MPERTPGSGPTGDAAERPGDAGRDRLARALVRPSRSQAVVGVLLAVLGFAAIVQVRSNQLDDTYSGRREQDLIEILGGLTGTSDRARREIERLEQTQSRLLSDTSARSAAVDQAAERVETLNILAGLVPVTGPGLRITITEETGRVSIDSLLDTVQELRTAGAEAMEFNDEVRLAAESSFDEVDGSIEVDGVPLDTPYVLEVIGETNTLQGGLTFPSGPISSLETQDGARVDVEELSSIDIQSVRSATRPEFAQPEQGQ